MECIGCGKETGDRFDTCRACEDAFEIWLAKAPEREEKERERLDSEGYYDDPEGWAMRKGFK